LIKLFLFTYYLNQGCGFVDFENPDEAEEARKALDNYKLPDSGRIISVKYADCKSRRMRKKLEETNESTQTIQSAVQTQQQITQDEINNNLEQLNRKASTSSLSSAASTSSNTISSSTASSPVPQNICLFSPTPDSYYQTISSFSSSFINDKADQYEWPDVWSKLLRTTDWKEYKYF
jgi:RNA recognition motif-containing protein